MRKHLKKIKAFAKPLNLNLKIALQYLMQIQATFGATFKRFFKQNKA